MINETINWAEAEKQYYKERDWLNEVKKLCKSEILNLRRASIPEGASKVEHYNNIVEEAYHSTQSLRATYLICASNWLPVFCLSAAFKRSFPDGTVNGSYTAGTYKDLPVIISPTMDSFEMLCVAGTPTPEYNIENIDSNKFILLKLED